MNEPQPRDPSDPSDEGPVRLSAAALAIATAHAARDRQLLASLVRDRRVRRDHSVGVGVAGAGAFRRDIEARVRPNLAIRPKKKHR